MLNTKSPPMAKSTKSSMAPPTGYTKKNLSFRRPLPGRPMGKRSHFYRFDESKVKEYQLTYYGDLYPEQYKYKYPKAGEDNSIIGIYSMIWFEKNHCGRYRKGN